MFEDAAGKVVSGALWGVGAGLVLRVFQGKKSDTEDEAAGSGANAMGPMRPVAKTAMKGVILASDRMRGVFAEARETIEDLYAEAQAETHSSSPSTNGHGSESRHEGNIPVEA